MFKICQKDKYVLHIIRYLATSLARGQQYPTLSCEMKNVFGHFQISLGGQNCPSLRTTDLKVRVLGLEKRGLQPALYNFFLIVFLKCGFFKN